MTRAYKEKDPADLTSADIAEMLEDYQALKEEQAEIDRDLLNLQKKQTALMVQLALVEVMKTEEGLTGAKAALDAFREYAEKKKRGTTVHDFFSDPDLPEILQQVRKRAIEILREKTAENDAKAMQEYTQAAIDSALLPTPNPAVVQFLLYVMNSNGENLQSHKGNRHEKVTVWKEGNNTVFERQNSKKGSSSKYVIKMEQAAEVLKKTGKTFSKCLAFSLEQMAYQNFPREVQLNLSELVDRGSYATPSNAKRAMLDFFETQKKITIGGIEKRGKRTIIEEGGVLFYHYQYHNGGMLTFSVNCEFDWDLIASYFTVFPRFAYALSNNAFLLVWYIFYLARQNTAKIRDGKPFTIGLEAVRAFVGLPDPAEVKNRKYRQYIMTPIEDAIEEIEQAVMKTPAAQNLAFTITPYGTDTGKIAEYLQGYLEIGLSGAFADTFAQIADNADKQRKRWQVLKEKEAAKLAAKKDASG